MLEIGSLVVLAVVVVTVTLFATTQVSLALAVMVMVAGMAGVVGVGWKRYTRLYALHYVDGKVIPRPSRDYNRGLTGYGIMAVAIILMLVALNEYPPYAALAANGPVPNLLAGFLPAVFFAGYGIWALERIGAELHFCALEEMNLGQKRNAFSQMAIVLENPPLPEEKPVDDQTLMTYVDAIGTWEARIAMARLRIERLNKDIETARFEISAAEKAYQRELVDISREFEFEFPEAKELAKRHYEEALAPWLYAAEVALPEKIQGEKQKIGQAEEKIWECERCLALLWTAFGLSETDFRDAA